MPHAGCPLHTGVHMHMRCQKHIRAPAGSRNGPERETGHNEHMPRAAQSIGQQRFGRSGLLEACRRERGAGTVDEMPISTHVPSRPTFTFIVGVGEKACIMQRRGKSEARATGGRDKLNSC